MKPRLVYRRKRNGIGYEAVGAVTSTSLEALLVGFFSNNRLALSVLVNTEHVDTGRARH